MKDENSFLLSLVLDWIPTLLANIGKSSTCYTDKLTRVGRRSQLLLQHMLGLSSLYVPCNRPCTDMVNELKPNVENVHSSTAQSMQSSRLSLQSFPLPPFGSRGRTHPLAGEGAGDPIRTKGQTLLYSRYCIIPPRCTVSYCFYQFYTEA